MIFGSFGNIAVDNFFGLDLDFKGMDLSAASVFLGFPERSGSNAEISVFRNSC